MNKLVSVIIPTYNRAKTLPRAIKSALSQSYKNIEVIIVDDGSTDNTEEIVKNYQDSRIVFLKHITNEGCAAALNTGISNVKGEYVAFLDSDDEWLPTKIEKQMVKFKYVDENVGVIYTNFFNHNFSSRIKPKRFNNI